MHECAVVAAVVMTLALLQFYVLSAYAPGNYWTSSFVSAFSTGLQPFVPQFAEQKPNRQDPFSVRPQRRPPCRLLA